MNTSLVFKLLNMDHSTITSLKTVQMGRDLFLRQLVAGVSFHESKTNICWTTKEYEVKNYKNRCGRIFAWNRPQLSHESTIVL